MQATLSSPCGVAGRSKRTRHASSCHVSNSPHSRPPTALVSAWALPARSCAMMCRKAMTRPQYTRNAQSCGRRWCASTTHMKTAKRGCCARRTNAMTLGRRPSTVCGCTTARSTAPPNLSSCGRRASWDVVTRWSTYETTRPRTLGWYAMAHGASTWPCARYSAWCSPVQMSPLRTYMRLCGTMSSGCVSPRVLCKRLTARTPSAGCRWPSTV